MVNLLATVRNHKGQIINNLTKNDFLLEEDGRPQTIQYFSQESDLPLTLGLLVDTSLSQLRVLGAERSASYQFLEQVLREDKDQAFVIHFDREVELLQDLTSSRAKLEAALKLLEMPQAQRQRGSGYPGPPGGGRGGGGGRGRGGGTLLYDAVLLASDEEMKKESGRKAVIVLSDGVDTGSRMTLEDGIRSAQSADTLAYSILFADEQGYGGGFGGRPGMGRGGRGGRGGRYPAPAPSRPDGKKVLQKLSRETGAAFYEVSKKQPIEKVFSLVEDELRHQYSLGYTPDKTDAGPGYRKLRLTTRNRDLVVQARDGYYASR